MGGTKTCQTCKWVKNPGEFAECVAPQNMEMYVSRFRARQKTLSVVGFGGAEETPNPTPRWIYCTTLRSGGWLNALATQACGESGRWWALRD